MDWIKDAKWEDHLTPDLLEVVELIGIENFLKLYKRFGKTYIYFSYDPVKEMRYEYIRNSSKSAKELAREFGYSERMIFAIRQKERISENQIDIFNDG